LGWHTAVPMAERIRRREAYNFFCQ
jgi:hypothetical protein